MATTTIRVTETSRTKLRSLARTTGLNQQDIIDRAVEVFRRQVFLESANRAFAEIRRDEATWDAELQERSDWDTAIADGIEADE